MEPPDVLHDVFQLSRSTSFNLEYSTVNSTELPVRMMKLLEAGVRISLAPGALSGARMMRTGRNLFVGPGLRILFTKVEY